MIKRREKGSITLFTLIAMMFFLTIAFTAYASAMIKLQAQNEDLERIKASYEQDLTEEGLASLYEKLTSKNNISKKMGYVTTGLMLHYDGFNNTGNGHSTTATVWKDLSGNGNDASITSSKTLDWENDCLATNKAETIMTPWKFETSYTISVVISPQDFYSFNTIWDNSLTPDDNECWIYSNGQLSARADVQNYIGFQYVYLYEKLHVTVVVDKEKNICSMWVDGRKISENQGLINLNGGQLSFNGSTNTLGKNQYYSMKVYNRALTDSEIEQNYNIDKTRFDNDEIETEKKYAEDGLKLHYDAINNTGNGHNAMATTWKDISGNNNDATVILDGSVNWKNDGLKFENTTTMATINPNIIDVINSDKFSIQFIVDSYNYGGAEYPTFLWSTNDNFSFYTYINGENFSLKTSTNNRPNINNKDLFNKLVTIVFDLSLQRITVFSDDKAITTTAANNGVYANNLNINRNQANTFVIKSLRIYNRTLTRKEVKQSYNMDKERFNIQ